MESIDQKTLKVEVDALSKIDPAFEEKVAEIATRCAVSRKQAHRMYIAKIMFLFSRAGEIKSIESLASERQSGEFSLC